MGRGWGGGGDSKGGVGWGGARRWREYFRIFFFVHITCYFFIVSNIPQRVIGLDREVVVETCLLQLQPNHCSNWWSLY